MRTKILVIITTDFVPYGGLTTVMMNYYRKLDMQDMIIDFASTNIAPSVLVDELRRNGSSYFCLGKRTHLFTYFVRLFKLCKGYDIIHINGNSATTVIELFAAKFAGVKKRINHNHTSIPDHLWISNMVYPLFKRLVTERVACSDLAGKWLYGDGNFMILKNAVDVNRFRYCPDVRKKVRHDLGIESESIVMGHIGKIYKPKNHPYLIRIFREFRKKVPNAILLLVGDGDMRQEVERLVDELELRNSVIFAGLRADVPDMLQAIDYFVFPSIWEGLPLSVFEAMASGLPCVVSCNITKEVLVSPFIHALSINEKPEQWAEFVIDNMPVESREKVCETNIQSITEAGYNINTEASKLKSLYQMA